MYTLNMSEEEHQALMDILETSISEIHVQIMHTDRWDLKECLKNRKQVLLTMLDATRKMKPVIASVAS